MDSDLKQRTMSGTPDSLSSSQLSDVLGQLENKDVETSVAAQQLLKRRLQSTRESWLLNGLWDHCMKGCSENLCKLIASTPDMHSGVRFCYRVHTSVNLQTYTCGCMCEVWGEHSCCAPLFTSYSTFSEFGCCFQVYEYVYEMEVIC